jgi:hypothetical protein
MIQRFIFWFNSLSHRRKIGVGIVVVLLACCFPFQSAQHLASRPMRTPVCCDDSTMVPLSPTPTPKPPPSTPTPSLISTPAPPQIALGYFQPPTYDRPLGQVLGKLCTNDTVDVLAYQMVGDERWLQVKRVRSIQECAESLKIGQIVWVRRADVEEPRGSVEDYMQAIGTTLFTPIPATPVPPTLKPRPPARPTVQPAPSSSGGGRIGAICRDGSHSNATGRGACSHHGGVDHWLYGR